MKFPRLAQILSALSVLSVGLPLAAQDSPPALPEGSEWQTTQSGLRYAVIEPGEGEPLPAIGDTVLAHYTGWLASNGTKFDSSRDKGQPYEFSVGRGVIAGWSEGVQLMPMGATYRFEIPHQLAYGPAGRPPRIPPRSTLIFDIELVDVEPAPRMPVSDPSRRKELEEGIVYEIMTPGEGDLCSANDIFSMHYSLFSPDGVLLQSSKLRGGPILATAAEMRVPLLQKMPQMMRRGSVFRCEVSKEKGLGVEHPEGMPFAVWVLEMRDFNPPLPLPGFEVPTEAEFESLERSPSGLMWKVLQEGEGEAPKPTDPVTVHYVGRLLDGTLFDSSFKRARPTTFRLDGVIRGWTEGVGMMKPGEIRVFIIPSDLAYGERGSGDLIKPGATLCFWVELIKVGE